MSRPDATGLPPLPPRDPLGHKGTFGTVAIVGGCALPESRMLGAPALAARAALRAGAGLARVLAPEPILDGVLGLVPAATGRALYVTATGAMIPHLAAEAIDEAARSCRCLAVGPGLGEGDGPRAATVRAIGQEDVPVVIDADGIRALAQTPQLTRDLKAEAVLTPHPGEFRVLCEGMGLRDHLGLASSRAQAAESLAQRLACVVVLKGAGTVVSDGRRTWTCPAESPVLATGGTGDVLTGLIAGLIAQFAPHGQAALLARLARPATGPAPGTLELFDLARLGVHIHAAAAEIWSQRRQSEGGMLPEELADLVPEAIGRMRAEARP
ncbi:MAG TPA: NAD(P)H-hydrate dehydratase [Phycisphaerales bacterium]|nr:NAD(P)H-hydrate dehydratase [Phycisphaerales bacterium]